MSFNIEEQVSNLFIGLTMEPHHTIISIEEAYEKAAAHLADMSKCYDIGDVTDESESIYDVDIPFYDHYEWND